MATDLYVVDADAHAVEPLEFFSELLQRFPDHVTLRTDTKLGVLIEGRPYPQYEGPGAGCPPQHGLTTAPGVDPGSVDGVLANADTDGIDEMVLFPSFGLCVPTLEDPVLGAGLARMYNRWASEFCNKSAGRLHGVAVVPIEHGQEAVKVMEEAKDLGLVATSSRPPSRTGISTTPISTLSTRPQSPSTCPWVCTGHRGSTSPRSVLTASTNYIQVHCVSFPFDQMFAMTALVSGGVFDRHPTLRVAFLEAGAGWLPWFVERLGEHYESRGDWIPNGWQRPPAQYVESGNVSVTCEPDEDALPCVVELLGDKCVMFASDYPHWDGAWPRASTELKEHAEGRVAPEALARVAAGNAQLFYNLPR